MNSQTLFTSASEDYRKGEYFSALASLNKLLDLQRDSKTYALLAKTLVQIGMKEEAAQTYELAGECAGSRAYNYFILSMRLYHEIGSDDEAIRIGLPLINEISEDLEAAYILGKALLGRGRIDMMEPLKDILLKSPDRNHNRIAVAPMIIMLPKEGDAERVGRLLKAHPEDTIFRSVYLMYQRENNVYPEIEKYEPQEMAEMAAGNVAFAKFENPLVHYRWCADERANSEAGRVPFVITPARDSATRHSMPHTWGKKIRIGYLSADFYPIHAVMKALTHVLELHDRNKFEIVLFDATPPEKLEANPDRSSWGEIVPIRTMRDRDVAEMARERGIDIMVDLQGWTAGTRVPIFNLMPAPIQVSWLGFPGTVANADIDYVIGDRTVLPMSSAPFYHEKFCRMPETFFPNDPVRRPVPNPFTRSEIGLPEDAFIFACFNSSYKISLTTIDLWIRILNETPDSVLWFTANKQHYVKNIAEKLERGGIARERLFGSIYAMDYSAHMSRVGLADVGLDTYPYNGHTTTSEQLWAGLPLLTFKGSNFASRVSESLLNAIGLPEMLAGDPDDYVRRAVDLYNNRHKVEEYKKRLNENRFRMPLFDSERFCRHLERAYEMMVERAKAGLKPDHFDVPAFPPREGSFKPDSQP